MNIRQIRQILKDTDFIHTSGTPQELRVAEYLARRCRELGAETRLEAFPVEMAEVHTSKILADGREIPCRGYRCEQGVGVPQAVHVGALVAVAVGGAGADGPRGAGRSRPERPRRRRCRSGV